MLGISVGYGYRPLRAVWFIGLFVLAGWGLFFLGYRRGLIVPTEREAYQSFLYDSTMTPSGYQNFNSFVYSLRAFFHWSNSFSSVVVAQSTKSSRIWRHSRW